MQSSVPLPETMETPLTYESVESDLDLCRQCHCNT
jgi:hypothetical protein